MTNKYQIEYRRSNQKIRFIMVYAENETEARNQLDSEVTILSITFISVASLTKEA